MYNIKILTALIFLMLVEQETSSLDLTVSSENLGEAAGFPWNLVTEYSDDLMAAFRS